MKKIKHTHKNFKLMNKIIINPINIRLLPTGTYIPIAILHRTNIVHVCIVNCIEIIEKVTEKNNLGKISKPTSIFSRTTKEIRITTESGERKCRKIDSRRTIRYEK